MTIRHFFLVLVVPIVGGCMAAPYADPSWYNGYYDTRSVRVAPCKAFRADELASWAMELDDKREVRSVSISVNNGNVNCTTHQSASSQRRSAKK